MHLKRIEAQKSKCQSLRCKACGKALSLRCHMKNSRFCIHFKQLQYLLHNFYIVSFYGFTMWLIITKLLNISLATCSYFRQVIVISRGNIHSLRMVVIRNRELGLHQIKNPFFLMSIQLYNTVRNLLLKISY